jgi:DNA-directed RNA polymerase subunit RPC12/RpoP
MIREEPRRHTGKCCDCGAALELVELDVEKGTKALRCMECGLVHFYKKELFGWKLVKASKK